MKKLTIIVLLLLSITLSAQWEKLNLPSLKYYNTISPTLVGLKDSLIFLKAESLYSSFDYGNNWIKIPTVFEINPYALFFTSKDLIIATGNNENQKNVFYRSLDNGLTWNLIDINEFNYNNFKNIIEVIDGTKNYLIAFSFGMDSFMLSSDKGTTWQKDKTNIPPYSIYSAVSVIGNHLFARDFNRNIFTSDDFGKNWVQKNININTSNLNVSSLIAVKNDLFLGTNVGLFKSTNLGNSWTLALQESYNNPILELKSDGELLYSSYRDWSTHNPIDKYYVSNNNGASWTQIPGAYLPAGIMMNSNFYVAISNNNHLVYSKDKGKTWVDQTTNFTKEYSYSINSFTSNNGYLFLVTSMAGYPIYKSSNNGISWDQTELTKWNIQQYVDSSSSSFYLGKYSLYKTTSNSWEPYPIPQGYPCTVHGCVSTYVYGFVPCGEKVILGGTQGIKYYNNQEPISLPCPGSDVYWLTSFEKNLFAACNCGILVSSDCGSSWKTLFQNFVPIRIVVNNYFICGITNDGWLCISKDNGKSWKYFNCGIKDIVDIGLDDATLFVATLTDTWKASLTYLLTDVELQNIPTSFSLSQNYPNPFNPETTISYTIPVETRHASSLQKVTLKVFDLLGREVATLVDEFKQAGTYNSQFSIRNYQLPSGVYFYRLQSGSYSETKKMILLK